MITAGTLLDLGACQEAIDAFLLEAPDGLPDWDAVLSHPRCHPMWHGWLAANVPEFDLDRRLRIVEALPDPPEFLGQIAAAPGLTTEQRMDLIRRSYDPVEVATKTAIGIEDMSAADRARILSEFKAVAHGAADVALRAPGLTVAERREFARAGPHPRICYGRIAANCEDIGAADRRRLVDDSDVPEEWAVMVLRRTDYLGLSDSERRYYRQLVTDRPGLRWPGDSGSGKLGA